MQASIINANGGDIVERSMRWATVSIQVIECWSGRL